MQKLLSACGCLDEAIDWLKVSIEEFGLFLEDCDGTDFTGEVEPTLDCLKKVRKTLQTLVDKKHPNIQRAIKEWETSEEQGEY